MSQAPLYTPITDFSTDELNNVGGRSTVGTAKVDAEFSAISSSINALRNNLQLVQRDDGQLRDGVVTVASLSPSVAAMLAAQGVTIRGAWTTATAYALKDWVTINGATYVCAAAHTSGTFALDLVVSRWLLVYDGGCGISAKAWGALGDGVANDWPAIQTASLFLEDRGGGVLWFPPGTYMVSYALQQRNGVTFRGEHRSASRIKAMPTAIDNVIGIGNYAYKAELAKRQAGYGGVDLQTPANFGADLARGVALFQGGYAGLACYGFCIENLTIDGNKGQRAVLPYEFVSTGTGNFLNGEVLTVTSGPALGATGIMAYGGPTGGSGYVFRPDPSTNAVPFQVGSVVTGSESGFVHTITGTIADDSLGMNIDLEICLNGHIKDCNIINSVYEGLVIYNECNNYEISGNYFFNNNKEEAEGFTKCDIICDFSNFNIRILRNVINGGLAYGLVVHDPGGTSGNFLIEDNEFLEMIGTAIVLDKAGNAFNNIQIKGNTIKARAGLSGSHAGILAVNSGAGSYTNLVVENNDVSGFNWGYIGGSGGVGDVNYVTISKNSFHNNYQGMAVSHTNATYFDNRNYGNTIPDSVIDYVDNLYPQFRGLMSSTNGVKGGTTMLQGATGITVGMSATKIADLFSGNSGCIFHVTGEGGGAGFSDLVMYAYGTLNVVSSNTSYGAPAARTYSRSLNEFRLAMASGSYSVRVTQIGNQH